MRRRHNITRASRQAGFTLLEVMIAITIMTVALGAILTSQSGGIIRTIKTKDLNLAGWLAHRTMVESEHLLEGKPFGEIEKEKVGGFDEEDFKRFKWKREVRELKFPDLTQGAKEGEGVPEALRMMSKVITKFLDTAVREMVITISWQHAGSEQTLTLSTYLVDLNAEFNFGI